MATSMLFAFALLSWSCLAAHFTPVNRYSGRYQNATVHNAHATHYGSSGLHTGSGPRPTHHHANGTYPWGHGHKNHTLPAPTCTTACTVEYPALSYLSWSSTSLTYDETTTITAATVYLIKNPRTNYSTTSVHSAELPYGFQPTPIATLKVPQGGDGFRTNRITFPGEYYDYDAYYGWHGVLPTGSVCPTSSGLQSNVGYTVPASHPLYPQPTMTSGPIPTSEPGMIYQPVWVPYNGYTDTAFFQSAFGDEAPFSLCATSTTAVTYYSTPLATGVTSAPYYYSPPVVYSSFYLAPFESSSLHGGSGNSGSGGGGQGSGGSIVASEGSTTAAGFTPTATPPAATTTASYPTVSVIYPSTSSSVGQTTALPYLHTSAVYLTVTSSTYDFTLQPTSVPEHHNHEGGGDSGGDHQTGGNSGHHIWNHDGGNGDSGNGDNGNNNGGSGGGIGEVINSVLNTDSSGTATSGPGALSVLPSGATPTRISNQQTTAPAYLVGSQTAYLGQTVTISGTPVVFTMDGSSTVAVVGGTTTVPVAGETSGGVGGFIWSGLGGTKTADASSSGTGVPTFDGKGAREDVRRGLVAGGFVIPALAAL